MPFLSPFATPVERQAGKSFDSQLATTDLLLKSGKLLS